MTLTDVAIKAASQGAIDYASKEQKEHGAKMNFPALSESLNAMIKIRMPEALADAKAALDANMGQVAEHTFIASMYLAGIEAAKECVYIDA